MWSQPSVRILYSEGEWEVVVLLPRTNTDVNVTVPAATVVYSLVNMTTENSQETSRRQQDGASNVTSPINTASSNNANTSPGNYSTTCHIQTN